MKIRNLLIVIAVVFFVLPVSVFGAGQTEGAESGQGPVTLTFLNWIAAEGASKEAAETMVEMFEEDHPNITIELQTVPYSQIRNQALTKATAGLAPDINQIPEHELSGLVEAGVCAPLDSYFSDTELDKFFQGDLKGCMFETSESENEMLYAIPWSPMPVTYTWNKNLFNQAGLDPDKPPKTWEEMTNMAREIASLGKDAEGNQIYGLGLRTDTSSGVGYWFLNTLWAFGGQFIDDDGNIVVNSDAGVAALNWYKQMVEENVMPAGVGIRDIRVMFSKNQVGMRWGVPAMVGIGRTQSGQGKEWDSQWGASVMPIKNTDEPVCFTSTHALFVSKQSKYKDEAVSFLKAFSMDKEITEYYFQEMGMLPPLHTLAESDVYNGPLVRPFLDALETAKAQPASNPQYMRAMDFLREAIQETLLEGVDAQSSLDRAAEKIELLYNK